MRRTREASPQTVTLLAVLLDEPAEWHHGYDLSKRTGLKSGTLYPVLMRLKELGMLESEWRPPERTGTPPRHEYRLTPQGVEYARSNTSLKRIAGGIVKERLA